MRPESAIVLGGTWRIPVKAGLLDRGFINDKKMDGTFNESSFAREYESEWVGSTEDAFFNSDEFDKNRILKLPEKERSGKSGKGSFYLLAIDVGRKGDNSIIEVLKCNQQPQGTFSVSLVNINSASDQHFEDQSLEIKKAYYRYEPRRIVIDGNGLGIGLVDYLVKPQIDPVSNDEYPGFGVYNDDEKYYDKFRTDTTITNMLYIIKAQSQLNNDAHANIQTQINSGKVKFLIDERTAKARLLAQAQGAKMSVEKRAEYLKPFVLTSILKEEMMNLREETEGVNIILKQSNRRIKKDKFSALEYGLYYLKYEEENKRKKKKAKISDMLFITTSEGGNRY